MRDRLNWVMGISDLDVLLCETYLFVLDKQSSETASAYYSYKGVTGRAYFGQAKHRVCF